MCWLMSARYVCIIVIESTDMSLGEMICDVVYAQYI